MANLPPVQLANSFIERFGQSNSITHLKLQKLCYFCYGWWLALRPLEPPLLNSKPQVWKFGPVFKPIYSSFASFKSKAINQMQPGPPLFAVESVKNDDSQPSRFIEWIWQKYGVYDGMLLSDWTHAPGTPWRQIAEEHNFQIPQFYEMSDDLNKTYFEALARQEGYIQ